MLHFIVYNKRTNLVSSVILFSFVQTSFLDRQVGLFFSHPYLFCLSFFVVLVHFALHFLIS